MKVGAYVNTTITPPQLITSTMERQGLVCPISP